MITISFKNTTALICACALVAGSWAYAQSPESRQPEFKSLQPPPQGNVPAQTIPTPTTEPPQLPTQPASVSPEMLRLLEMIERKNRELKKREEELFLKEKNLEALRAKVLADLGKIEEALARSEEMVGIKKDLIEKNVRSLVQAYSNMKPAQAAALLENMDQGIAIIIVSRMKSRDAGKVLGAMNTRIAKGISEKIAGKKDSPE